MKLFLTLGSKEENLSQWSAEAASTNKDTSL